MKSRSVFICVNLQVLPILTKDKYDKYRLVLVLYVEDNSIIIFDHKHWYLNNWRKYFIMQTFLFQNWASYLNTSNKALIHVCLNFIYVH